MLSKQLKRTSWESARASRPLTCGLRSSPGFLSGSSSEKRRKAAGEGETQGATAFLGGRAQLSGHFLLLRPLPLHPGKPSLKALFLSGSHLLPPPRLGLLGVLHHLPSCGPPRCREPRGAGRALINIGPPASPRPAHSRGTKHRWSEMTQ